MTNPEDTAVILYTSGTTGFPKGAELSHSNMIMNAIGTRHLLQGTADDIHVIVLPLEIIKGIEKKYKIPILEGYGLSETCPVATFSHLTKELKPGSIGTPIWGVEVEIFDKENNSLAPGEVGELFIRGHNVMKGYYNKPEATREAFGGTPWFHTGDLGKKDEDGFFYIVDRVKDMIIRGGYNVYPREIEEVLLTHPQVSLASVLGIPHPSHGEEIVAYIVPRPGSSITEADLIEWSKEQMAAYKYPRRKLAHKPGLSAGLPVEFSAVSLKKGAAALFQRVLWPGKGDFREVLSWIGGADTKWLFDFA